MNKNRVFYYMYDKKLVAVSKNIPNIGHRAAVVQSLIATYNLLQNFKICLCEEATDEDLLLFHSSDYLECLKKAESSDLEKISDSEEYEDFNLGYDCPLFEGIYEFVKLIAGSSLTLAKKLVKNNFQLTKKIQLNSVSNSQPRSYLKFKNGLKVSKEKNVFDIPLNFGVEEFEEVECDTENIVRTQSKMYDIEIKHLESNMLPICVNWFGGWHHAQRDEAGGFCYINDIVIAIQYLLKFYKRVVYIDLDVHHGNGVENAFLFSSKVLTFSIHKYETGFYPASGSITDVGQGKGKFYTVNVPLKSGITDDKYVDIFKKILIKIIKKYQPECVVVQCGADCLAGDPLGGFNLTLNGIGECLKIILNQKLPTMVLGGGGYNIPNTARCWAYLTSVILECSISNDIPDNSIDRMIHHMNENYIQFYAPAILKKLIKLESLEDGLHLFYVTWRGWLIKRKFTSKFLHLYGPEFEIGIAPSLQKDENSDEYLQTVVTTILQNLDNISVK